MKVTGIIMECNPFHEGHAYLLREARRQTQADHIVVAMSGDFVQRGEPAVYDKYLRAREILEAGADLVLELPLYSACGSAEYFARGGIALLDRLGVVTDLCFGSESGDADLLRQCAQVLSEAETDPDSPLSGRFRGALQAGLRSGLSFPAARAAAVAELGQDADRSGPLRDPAPASARDSGLPSTPNDLLAVEYCRALLAAGSPIRPHAIRRIEVPSATWHRTQLLLQRSPGSAGPEASGEATGLHAACRESGDGLVPRFPLGPEDFSSQFLYALHMHAGALDQYVDVSPDLRDRIGRLIPQYQGYGNFCDLVKTKNVTRTRISRAMLHILLQMEKDRLASLSQREFALYARPLAMRRDAGPLLSAIHDRARIPFLPKLSAASSILDEFALQVLEEEIRAEDLYILTLWNTASPEIDEISGRPRPAPGAMQRRIVTCSQPLKA